MSEQNFITSDKEYFYPKYVPSQQIIKGLYVTEWLTTVAPAALGLMLFQIFGFIVGLVFSATLWIVFVRQEGQRTNFAYELSCILNYYTTQQEFRKTGRSEIKGNIIEEIAPIENDKDNPSKRKEKQKPNKKKVNKKEQRKKEKNMEELFPFRDIKDGYIIMENNTTYFYFLIQASSLDLMSKSEISNLEQMLSKNIDSSKFSLSFFIQDSIFNISRNIEVVDQNLKVQKNPFLRRLLDENKEIMLEEKEQINKKSYYLRIMVDKKAKNILSPDEIVSRVIKNFNDSLDLVIASQDQLKQMLAIYGNRIFEEKLPDTEVTLMEPPEKKKLIRNKKQSFKDLQLPGIYMFKNLIVPLNTSFKPSTAKLGRNLVKTYAVTTFLGSTKDTNLFKNISNIKGVTTSIYIDKLRLDRYRNNMKLEIRSKKATIDDEVDEMDAKIEGNSLKGTYKRAREEKQNMYYLSAYFQITAKTQAEFEKIEEVFLQEIDNVNISIDELKTQQKEGFLTVSPIGTNKLGDFCKQNIPSESVSNLYPFNDPSLLDETGLPIGNICDSTTMVLYDPFTYRGSNNNILVLGQSGRGKTVAVMNILQICAMKNYYIRNIDFEGTYCAFFERIGGVNIDVSGGNEFAINPLQIRIPDEIKVSILNDYVSEVVKWISIYKPAWSQELLELFEIELQKAYAQKGITNESNFKALKNTDFPILSDVYKIIEHDRANFDSKSSVGTEDLYRKLLLGLNSAVNGADAKMFNRYTNLGDNDLDELRSMNFDMSKIMSSDKSRKLAQLSNIFTFNSQFINDNLGGDKRIILSVDELDQALSVEFLPIIEIFNDYERRFRKRNACFLKATQTIDELNTKLPELEAKIKPLFSQPATKLIFHLGDIDYSQPQKMMGLTATEISKLKEVRNGKCLMKINKAVFDFQVTMPDWFAEVKPDVKKRA